MEKYTVHAIARLLAATPREYITGKELTELKTRLNKLATRGPAEAVTAANHNQLIETLLRRFTGRGKIPTEELIAAVHAFLQQHNYSYTVQQRAPAHPAPGFSEE